MNPNIALSLRGVQVRDPSEAYQKALTLKSLMGQQEMQGMQLQQARDKMAEDDAIKQAGIDSGGDPNLTIKALMSKGYYGPAMQLQKMYGESEKHRYDALKSRGEVSELQRKLQAQHASAILSATPENVAAVWQATRQQAIEAGIPGAEQSPPEWDERMRPQIEADQMQGLNTKDALAEIASRPSVPSTVQALTSGPTPIAPEDVGMQPQDFGKFTVPEGAKTMADVVPYLSRDQELAAAEGQVVAYPGADGRLNLGSPQVAAERQTALTTGKVNAPPAEAETQKPAITAEGLRRQANELESLGGVARLERAHKLRQDANALEQRELEIKKMDAETWSPVPGAPGVTFNKKTNEFVMNGKPISAEEVQKIAARQSKAGASNINQSVGMMNPTDAAKTELLNQGISDMVELRGLLMPDGKIDRQMVIGMNVPFTAGAPYTDSRIAYSLILNSIESKLRAESGAAVPEAEVIRIAERFRPSIVDSDDAIRNKLRRLEAFLRGSFGRIKNAGEPTTKTSPAKKEDEITNFEDLK